MAEPATGTTETGNRGDRQRTMAEEAKRGAERGARTMRDMAEHGSETARQQIGSGVDAVKTGAEGVEAVARRGLHVVGEVQGMLADVGHDQGRRSIQTAARVTDIYREAAENTADDVHALISSTTNLGRGLQQIWHAWFDLLNESIETAARQPHDLLRCSSPVELAEVQSDLYRDGVTSMLRASGTLFQLVAQTAQEAGRPLQGRFEAARR